MDVRGLEYPCAYPVKVFLKPDAAAEAELLTRVRAAAGADSPVEVSRNTSRGGAYICLTLTFTATDADHALRVGAAARDAPGVLLSV